MHRALVVMVLLVGACCAGTMAANLDQRPAAPTNVEKATRTSRIEPAPLHRPTASVAVPTQDLVAWYDSVRDETNPTPRLRAIEAWDRSARPDASIDLLTHALVDPDPSVRERAQALFDRRMPQR